MGIIKLGVMVAGVRGTIGGVTFSQNKSGPNARLWSRSSNPLTSFQTTQRSLVAQMPPLWNALSPVEQTAWDTWAALPAQERTNRLGEAFFLSGFQAFNMINTRLLHVGRADRTAPPVSLVPAAPTISSLQLPFLEEQTAKIVYPSGTFAAPHDVIIMISVSPSIGRQVRPQLPLALLESQTPGLVDTGFLVPYLNRFAQQSDTYKGFGEIFAQTTDGQRSAATGVTFLSSDSAPYTTTAEDFDGLVSRTTMAGMFTGATDTQQSSFSMWFRRDGGIGSEMRPFSQQSNRWEILFPTDNRLRFQLRDPTTAVILQAFTTSTFTSTGDWNSVQFSWDSVAEKVTLAVNGVPETPTIGGLTPSGICDYTASNIGFAGEFAGARKFDGCLSDFYYNHSEFLDFSDPSTIALFVSPGRSPMELGAQGNFPTGSQPAFFFPAGDSRTNAGFGGNFTLLGPFAACSSSP